MVYVVWESSAVWFSHGAVRFFQHRSLKRLSAPWCADVFLLLCHRWWCMLFWSPAQQWNCCRYKLISKYERRQIFVGNEIFSSTLTGLPTLLQGVRGFLADVLSGWCGRKNTEGLNYDLTLPSVTLEEWGQFGWLVWVFFSSVSFSAAGEHRFAASSHVASLTWLLLQQQHLTNSFLFTEYQE